MKKKIAVLAGFLCLSLGNSFAQSNLLGTILKSVTNGTTVSNMVSSVLGTDKPSENDLVGTWKYKQPGVAFTSDKLLAKAGGEVAATEMESKLKTGYDKLGLKSSNTQFTFNSDKTFNGMIDGKSLTGTWTYDESNQKVTLKTLLLSIPMYVKKENDQMSFLMESKKLLTFLQTAASLSGNSTLKTLSSLSKNYSGMRMGFDMSK